MRNRPDQLSAPKFTRWHLWAALLITILISLAIVIVPVWIIRPFTAQSARGLGLSYLLRRWSPVGTLVATGIVLVLVFWLWRRSSRWWSRFALIILLPISLIPAWFSRQNHFEWMFNPLPSPEYQTPSAADFVDDADMVLAVENNGDAVAYPIRQMAYHHVVHDSVGGIPIVATY
jgi:uncharacterized protein DUF3179